MFSKFVSTAAVVLAAGQLVSAQTTTDCNPMKKTCPADPAVGTTTTIDFTKGENDFFKAADGTSLTYDDTGALFTINTETDAPTITSNKYIFFGKVDLEVQVAPGAGIVTSFVLQSDDLDEIDWEWIGSDTTQAQSDYFGKGDTTTYDRGAYHDVSDPQGSVYTYSVEWTKDHVLWLINGNQVRELKYADAENGSRFPQTPMQIKLGTWCAGGNDSAEGTREWAGGYTDFSQAPFVAHYKSITIQDYSDDVSGATEYVWADGSDGSYESITVVTGDSNDTSSSTTATSTAKSTKTATSDATSTNTSDSSKTTLSTATVSATSTSTGSSSSASGTATNEDSEAGSSSNSSSSSTSSSTAAETSPVTAGAFKVGFSGAAFGACLLAAFML
ncbi:glycoside hydrolase family 16 protein [Hypoxylon sp. FL1150]|nr:glycoside hydrolase family 16 protein [Hypoxylon sp. FL1150]